MTATNNGLTRRTVLKGIGTAAVAAATGPLFYTKNAWAEGQTINVGTYKGPQAEYIRKQVIPQFEADYKCKVNQSEGSTLNQIALLRIQRAAPTFSVMFLDDVGVPIAREEDLIAPLRLNDMPNSQKVASRFVVNDQHGIAFCLSTVAPFYNTGAVQPVTSYEELWNESFRDSFMMVTAKQTQGVFLPVVAAALKTGLPILQAQYKLSEGWEKMAAFKPNVQTIYEAGVTSVLQVSQGQAMAGGLEMSKIVLPYTAKGAAVDLCYPREGVFGVLGCMTLVNNGPNPELATAFMNRMLDKDLQKGLAEASFAAPTISGVELSPSVAKLLPYGEARLDEMKLSILDWTFINTKRAEIIERTNEIFGVRT